MNTTGFDEVHVFTYVNEYILDELDIARNYLKTVQLKLAKGIQHVSLVCNIIDFAECNCLYCHDCFYD